MRYSEDDSTPGMAPACPACREPLAEDGSCWYCETEACAICGEVVPADKMVDVAEQGRCCPVCAAPDSDGVPVEEVEAETVRETTLTDAEMIALRKVAA